MMRSTLHEEFDRVVHLVCGELRAEADLADREVHASVRNKIIVSFLNNHARTVVNITLSTVPALVIL